VSVHHESKYISTDYQYRASRQLGVRNALYPLDAQSDGHMFLSDGCMSREKVRDDSLSNIHMHWAWICFALTLFFALTFLLNCILRLHILATNFCPKSLAWETRNGYLFNWRVLLIGLGVIYSWKSVDGERNTPIPRNSISWGKLKLAV
jgi:hypothetical protein